LLVVIKPEIPYFASRHVREIKPLGVYPLERSQREASCGPTKGTPPGKTDQETTSLLIEGSNKINATKEKAFRKRKWWQSGDDELAEYDRRVEVWTSQRQPIQRHRGGRKSILDGKGSGSHGNFPISGLDIRY